MLSDFQWNVSIRDTFISSLAIIAYTNRTLKMEYSYEGIGIHNTLILKLLKKIIN